MGNDISQVWLEMITLAAIHCGWKEHAKALALDVVNSDLCKRNELQISLTKEITSRVLEKKLESRSDSNFYRIFLKLGSMNFLKLGLEDPVLLIFTDFPDINIHTLFRSVF
ncbi:hypothetical protein SADUNF_Sadunf06G0008400 [Salix dunnii]|uniref:Uncharacterized protein n=1 Tax=Salix dunnii TaxID=1413687 RepID=A0A835K0A8_9ROSI|nr:hypothetical protein SADUNF_Sadunf06G0008400 [Salix dunnii]